MPCILNAANEVVVCAFLEERIGFLEMSEVIEYTMNRMAVTNEINIELLEQSDLEARRIATDYIYKN